MEKYPDNYMQYVIFLKVLPNILYEVINVLLASVKYIIRRPLGPQCT